MRGLAVVAHTPVTGALQGSCTAQVNGSELPPREQSALSESSKPKKVCKGSTYGGAVILGRSISFSKAWLRCLHSIKQPARRVWFTWKIMKEMDRRYATLDYKAANYNL